MYVQRRRTKVVEVQGLVTTPEAARRIGVNPLTVKRWARAGKLEGSNLAGRLWAFRRDDVERLAAERRAARLGT